MTTIPRNNTQRIAELKVRLTQCRVYRESNQFEDRPCDAVYAWEALGRNRHARLTVNERNGNSATVHVHGNLWYELSPPAQAAAEQIAADVLADGWEPAGDPVVAAAVAGIQRRENGAQVPADAADTIHQERRQRVAGDIRYHSSDDMDGLGEFRDVSEPVAVVLRRDGSVDVYGLIAVVDQRQPGRPGPVTSAKDADDRARRWALEGHPLHPFEGNPGEPYCRICGGGPDGIQHREEGTGSGTRQPIP